VTGGREVSSRAVQTLTLRRSFLVLLTTTGLALAQLEPKPAKPADPAPSTTPATLRVHVIGASLSGGFRDGPMTGAAETGDSVTMQHVLKAWCGEHAKVSTHSTLEMMATFTNPEQIGDRQVQNTLKQKPDAVVALDFPFWFAYGHVKGDEATARGERFAKGLELLGKLEGPLLVGDLPDMHGAERRMLSPAQIPAAEILKDLNARLAAFAKEHTNVHLVPIAELTKTMKEKGAPLPLAAGPMATPPGALLQGDKLHPNRLGMALLAFTLQPALRELFPAGHALQKQQWTFEQFVEACGAEGEIEALRSKAKDGAAAGDGAGKAPAGKTPAGSGK
jgi:hypothetical protein